MKTNGKTYRLSIYFLLSIAIIGVLAPLLANHKPLLAKSENGYHFPFLQEKLNTHYTFKISAPIPYSASTIDYNQTKAISPFEVQQTKTLSERHWLGTDHLGRDVLAQLIHACKTVLLVAFGGIGLALFIGLLLGGISAYWSDDKKQMNQIVFIGNFIAICILISTLILIPPYSLNGIQSNVLWSSVLIVTGLNVLLWLIINHFCHLLSFKFPKKINLPFDLIINRFIETIESLPLLMIVVVLSAIFKGGMGSLILIIGFTAWTRIAKYFRGEILKVKSLGYIESAESIGLTDIQIFLKHIMPNAISPVLVSTAFGIVSAIMIEASLSFLGIGLSAEEASWGGMIASARNNLDAWWLGFFPGIALFLTLLSCNTIAKHFSK